MSKIEALRKQSAQLDHEISRAKKAAYMSSNGAIFDPAKEMEKLEKRKEIKNGALATIKEITGSKELSEERAPKSLAKVLYKYSQELELETQNSKSAEEEFNILKSQHKFYKGHTEDFEIVRNSKAYFAYCRKRIKKIHVLYSTTTDDIIDDIQRLRKITKRILRRNVKQMQADIEPYQEEVQQIVSDNKKESKKIKPKKENFIKKIEEFQTNINDNVKKIAFNPKQSMEVINKASQRTTHYINQSLTKSFLIKLFIYKKIENMTKDFTKVIKEEGIDIPTVKYDLQIQKAREEVETIKQKREQEQLQKKTEMENLDKEIAELENYLINN